MSYENATSKANLQNASPDTRLLLKEAARLLATNFAEVSEVVDKVLDTMLRLLPTRTVFLARFETGENGVAIFNVLAVKDHGGCPMTIGPSRLLEQTYCNTIANTIKPLVVDDANKEPFYRCLAVTDELHIRSYIGVPLIYSNGQVYGTLCGIDPVPLPLSQSNEWVDLLQILARLIIARIETEKRQEHVSNDNQARDRFLGTVAHDLRSPLTAVLGYSQLLRTRINSDKMTPERLEQWTRLIEQNTQRVLGQINELMDYTSGSANKISVGTEPVLLAPLLEAVYRMTEMQAEARNISMHLQLPTGTEHEMVSIDMERFGRAVSNLMSNALKFTPEHGHITLAMDRATISESDVTLEADPFQTKDSQWFFANTNFDQAGTRQFLASPDKPIYTGKWVAIHVVDDGLGIVPNKMSNILDTFRQVRNVDYQRQQGEGTGLGLSIVTHFIGLMGGQLAIRSMAGQGSCFTIFLPALPD